MENENRVPLWMGITHETEEAYRDDFAIDYATEGDLESPAYRVCGFCKDIGRRWYDEDFIGIISRTDEPLPVQEWFEEMAVDPEDHEKVLTICAEKGITTANAMFWYQDASLTLPEPHRESYNGLQYIGVFEGD